MTFREDHELHTRRFGRNLGVGVALVLFVGIIYGVTVVKALENGIPDLEQAIEASE